jgi:uncharacterized protein
VIFVDSNVPMYLIGGPHPNKDAAIRAVESLVRRRVRMVSSAEILQEILHRYSAAARTELVQPCFRALLGMVDEVFPVEQEDVLRARDVLMSTPQLSARDSLHVAVMERRGVSRILSFDRGFDRVQTIERVP